MLDIREERKFNQLRKLTRELHVPMLESLLTLEVFDKNGRLLHKHHQRSHSWVRNAYNALFSNLASVNMDDASFGAGFLSGKNTDGVTEHGDRGAVIRNTTYESTLFGFRAAAGEDGWGIQVGSATDAESFEDYKLLTKLTHGAGAGQIDYAEPEAIDKSYAGLVWTNTLIRYFNNNTGNDRPINEVALVSKYYYFGSAGVILMSRDKLASTITVPDTGQLKVTYTIQLTYPS